MEDTGRNTPIALTLAPEPEYGCRCLVLRVKRLQDGVKPGAASITLTKSSDPAYIAARAEGTEKVSPIARFEKV